MKIKDFHKQSEKDECDGETNDNVLLLELLKCSTILLLYKTNGMQKETHLYRRCVKFIGRMVAWDVFDFCDQEIVIEAKKHP